MKRSIESELGIADEMPDGLGEFVGFQRGERDDLDFGEFVFVFQAEKQRGGCRAGGLGGPEARKDRTGRLVDEICIVFGRNQSVK